MGCHSFSQTATVARWPQPQRQAWAGGLARLSPPLPLQVLCLGQMWWPLPGQGWPRRAPPDYWEREGGNLSKPTSSELTLELAVHGDGLEQPGASPRLLRDHRESACDISDTSRADSKTHGTGCTAAGQRVRFAGPLACHLKGTERIRVSTPSGTRFGQPGKLSPPRPWTQQGHVSERQRQGTRTWGEF